MPNKQQADARKLLNVLRAVKSRQDDTAQPNRGRGLWLTAKLWQALSRHLEQQASDVEALQQVLYEKEQEAEQLRQQLDAERSERARLVEDMQAQEVQLRQQAEFPLAELGALRSQMRSKQESWNKQKYELEGQLDRLMGVLRTMGLLANSEGQRHASAPSPPGVQGYASEASGLTAPEAQALQIRELSMLLADARHQVESYRRQLALRGVPAEEMAIEIKRLKADNQRLVALLAQVPEYRAMAAEMAAESGVHYIPVEETLMMKGLVTDLHPQLLDRGVEEVAGQQLAGAGRKRDPDGPDPSLTLVLDEQYHWVPRKALETGAALMRRMMPALPMSQLLVLVAELNKVWRDRERQRLAEVAAAHQEELRRLQHTFQQRAPYEAVVAGQKVTDLKRRMRAQAAQAAAAAAIAKAEQRRAEEDSKVMLHAGLSSIQDLSRQVARLVARNKKLSSKASRPRMGPAQPLCSSCLDRLLLPPALGQTRPGALDLQQQQQLRLDTAAHGAAAAPGDEQRTAETVAAVHAGARLPEGPYGYMDSYPDAGPSPTGGIWYDAYGSREADQASAESPRGLLAPDVPTFNLTSRSGMGPAAATGEPYSSGTVVRVNTPPPPRRRPPTMPAASPNARRAREDAAAAWPSAALTSTATAAAMPGQAPAAPDVGSRGNTLRDQATHPGWHLGPTSSGSIRGVEVSAPTAAADAPTHVHGHGSGVETSDVDDGAGAMAASGAGVPATVELSTASLADWRTSGSAPITVRVQIAGSSPSRSVAYNSGVAQAAGVSGYGSELGSVGGGPGDAAPLQLELQPQLQTRPQSRGVPVRVRVRFPRQDVVLA